MKMLKRHLRTSHGMTPEEYRQKWGLPASYPMAAPNYASYCSSLAKQLGLGQKPGGPAPTNLAETSQDPDPPTGPSVTLGPARRARGIKVKPNLLSPSRPWWRPCPCLSTARS